MKRYLFAALVLATGSAHALGCEYERNIDVDVVLAGSEKLTVVAAAGELHISGRTGITEARAHGRVCVSEEKWLDEAKLDTEGGRGARVAVVLPDHGGWKLFGSHYAYMDLTIEVPEGTALDVQDSSGDIGIDNVGPLTVHDSSGNIDIDHAGPLSVRDSSGDIDIDDVKGDITVEDSSGYIDVHGVDGNVTVVSDSSGDIRGSDIQGGVLVQKDSSGNIRFIDVRDDFVVERDSSGDVAAEDIGGDFRVLSKGSGRISSKGVSGKVETPENR